MVSGFKPHFFDAYYYGIPIHVVRVACSVAKAELNLEGYYYITSLPECGFHLGSKGFVQCRNDTWHKMRRQRNMSCQDREPSMILVICMRDWRPLFIYDLNLLLMDVDFMSCCDSGAMVSRVWKRRRWWRRSSKSMLAMSSRMALK